MSSVTYTLDYFQDKIEQWHQDENTDLELHEYLGLSWEEYCTLVEEGRVNDTTK